MVLAHTVKLPFKSSRGFLATLLAIVVFGGTLFIPPASASYSFIVLPTRHLTTLNASQTVGKFPFSATFTVNSSVTLPGSKFLWSFGDGTNSTELSVTHTFRYPCLYDITLVGTGTNGSKTYAALYLALFGPNSGMGSLAVCPPSGTPQFIDIEVAGTLFTGGSHLTVDMNGTAVGNAIADSIGDWSLSVTGLLPAGPNGTTYLFTTVPASETATFTAVEGIEATPGAGAPGTLVLVRGCSYPSNSQVQVFLGGVLIGTEQASADGSFTAGIPIPSTAPLTAVGNYQYTTGPPILGTGGSFVSSGGGTSAILSASYWPWILLLVLIAIAVLLIWAIAKRRRRDSGETSGPPPPRIRR